MTKQFYWTCVRCWLTLFFFAALPVFVLAGDEDEIESGDGKSAADQPVAASEEGKQAMLGFAKPEGWSVSLFAAEPSLANPVTMTVDNLGRLFVCESFRQDRGVTDNRAHDREWLLADLAAQSVQDRIDYHHRLLGTEAKEYTAHDDRIRRLVDTDGDGESDQMTIFAEGFNKIEDGSGAGILVRGNQTFFTCIPKLWLLTDQDDDGQAEQRKALHDGYGVRVAFRGHDLHGLVIGPDGRMYFSIGDRGYNIDTPNGKLHDPESGAVFRCELDGSNLEVYATGLRNPQELAFDDYGFLFTGDNNSDSGDQARWVQVMQGGDTGWRMMYQYLPDRGPFNREHIWEPYDKEVTPAYIVPPIANISDGPSGLACYPGTGLTGDFANCFFLVDFRGTASNSGVRLIRSQRKGAFWEIERSEQPLWNILATDFEFGPDGAMWVCDWVEGWVGEGKGRVYRFQDDEAQQQDVVKEVQQRLAAGFADLELGELEKLLAHLDRRLRNEAQWELVARKNRGVFEKVLANRSLGTIARLHAVWGLGQLARLQPEFREQISAPLTSALSDEDLDIRSAALSVIGDLQLASFSEQVVQAIADPEPRVQYAACLAASELQLAAAKGPAVALLAENSDEDPGLRHAGIMALVGAGDLSELVEHDSASVRLATVVALRKRADSAIADFLSDSDARVQLEAARAVHDVPALHEALPQLAAIELKADAEDALVHRVLNANFRLAAAGSANRIAAVASEASRSEAMRLEALDMLGKWSKPGKLDRVMNRFMPVEDRNNQDAKSALTNVFTALLDGPESIQSKVLEVATTLEFKEAEKVFETYALDSSRSDGVRVNALRGLTRSLGIEAKSVLTKLLSDPSVRVRANALDALTGLDLEAALPQLTKALVAEDLYEAQAAWDTLAQVDHIERVNDLIDSGAEQYLSGKLRPELWLNVLEAVERKAKPELLEQLTAFAEAKAEESVLEGYRECRVGGDVEAGKKLFFEKTELSCVRCHKVAETGGEVGPDLSLIAATKDSQYLLQAIVDPDAKIAEKFETVILLTEDDEILTGIVRSETEDFIELIDAEGKITKVESDIVIHRKKGKSAMPADLIKQMSRRELRDLVAYLSSLKPE